jgi:hypothetical protein
LPAKRQKTLWLSGGIKWKFGEQVNVFAGAIPGEDSIPPRAISDRACKDEDTIFEDRDVPHAAPVA